MTAAEFKKLAGTIPAQPGIYKYSDDRGELLYVGKARNLRKRVQSYFNKTLASYKTHELVRRIARIECTVVDSEQDAFLLENALIKQFQPRFNINLKDDKTYPYLVIRKESFPRVFLTRRVLDDGSEYLGPYTSVKKVRDLLEFIRQTIPLRTCNLDLSPGRIKKGTYKVCLEYHLGNCKGPCEGRQTEEAYQKDLVQLRNLLRGNLSPVIRHFRDEMKQLAAELAFEKAEWIRKKIEFLETYQSRSVVVSTRTGDLDVFSFDTAGTGTIYLNYLMVRNGTIIQTHSEQVLSKLGESPAALLPLLIDRVRERFRSDATDILVPISIEYPRPGIRLIVPRAGDRKKLLELSQKNAAYFRREQEQRDRLQLDRPAVEPEELLQQVQDDLRLQDLPVHIECFDNSHFQGSYPVSAMVCFRNGSPSLKDYRHFNVKTVTGIDDFATMKEAVFRRYKRLYEEEKKLPQLIIIDGGKGQLSAASAALEELGLQGRTTLIGLAKNEEVLFFTGDSEPLRLPMNSPSLTFIRKIRDEVHRFGISFHRRQRSRGTFKNELESIPGIGKMTADTLLRQFRSVKRVSNCSIAELETVIGKKAAERIYRHFHPREKQ